MTLTATADVTEADSGVGFLQCLYRSPNSATGIYTSSAPQLTSQVGSSWTYVLSATFPQYSAQGTWAIEWCYVQDQANNARWYYTPQTNGLGFPVSFDQGRSRRCGAAGVDWVRIHISVDGEHSVRSYDNHRHDPRPGRSLWAARLRVMQIRQPGRNGPS